MDTSGWQAGFYVGDRAATEDEITAFCKTTGWACEERVDDGVWLVTISQREVNIINRFGWLTTEVGVVVAMIETP